MNAEDLWQDGDGVTDPDALRARSLLGRASGTGDDCYISPAECDEIADEIERLRGTVAEQGRVIALLQRQKRAEGKRAAKWARRASDQVRLIDWAKRAGMVPSPPDPDGPPATAAGTPPDAREGTQEPRTGQAALDEYSKTNPPKEPA